MLKPLASQLSEKLLVLPNSIPVLILPLPPILCHILFHEAFLLKSIAPGLSLDLAVGLLFEVLFLTAHTAHGLLAYGLLIALLVDDVESLLPLIVRDLAHD